MHKNGKLNDCALVFVAQDYVQYERKMTRHSANKFNKDWPRRAASHTVTVSGIESVSTAYHPFSQQSKCRMSRISGPSQRRSLSRGRTRTPRNWSRRRTFRRSQLTPAEQLKTFREGNGTGRKRNTVKCLQGPGSVSQGFRHSENSPRRALFSSTERKEVERSRDILNLEGCREPSAIVRRQRIERSALRRSRRLSLQGIERPQRPQLVPGASNISLEETFADTFEEAKLERVELDQCVSLRSLRVRSLLKFGIDRTVDILSGRSIGLVTGYTHVGKFPVVVELPGSYMEQVVTFFDEKAVKDH